MARIRSAKPEFWTDPKMGSLKREVRFTFKGIWEVCADDEGRFLADPRIIKGQVWPLDDDITPKKIEAWLKLLASAPVSRLVLYEVDGARYGWIPTWLKHQKISHPTASKLPAPPGETRERRTKGSGNIPEPLRKSSGAIPEPLRPDVDVDGDDDRDVEEEVEGERAAAFAASTPAALFGVSIPEEFPEAYRDDLDAVLTCARNTRGVIAELQGLHDDVRGAGVCYTWDEIGLGVHDLVVAGKHERLSARQLRRYVEGAREQTAAGSRSAGAATSRDLAQAYEVFDELRREVDAAGGYRCLNADWYAALDPAVRSAISTAGGLKELADANDIGVRIWRKTFAEKLISAASELAEVTA